MCGKDLSVKRQKLITVEDAESGQGFREGDILDEPKLSGPISTPEIPINPAFPRRTRLKSKKYENETGQENSK